MQTRAAMRVLVSRPSESLSIEFLFVSFFLSFSFPFFFFYSCASATTRRGDPSSVVRRLKNIEFEEADETTVGNSRCSAGDRGRERSVNVFIFAEFAGIEIFFFLKREDFSSIFESWCILNGRRRDWNFFRIWKSSKSCFDSIFRAIFRSSRTRSKK